MYGLVQRGVPCLRVLVHRVSTGESMALTHTYSYTYFYFTKETKGGKQKLYRFEYREVQTFIQLRRMKRVWRL